MSDGCEGGAGAVATPDAAVAVGKYANSGAAIKSSTAGLDTADGPARIVLVSCA